MTTLVEGAVESGKSVIIFGSGPATSAVLAALTSCVGSHEPLDLRNASHEPPPPELRVVAENHLFRDGTLVVLLGTFVSDAARAVIAEVIEGQLVVAPGRVRRFEEGRVIALSPDNSPSRELLELFPIRLPAPKALAPTKAGA